MHGTARPAHAPHDMPASTVHLILRPGPDFRGSLIAWLLIQYLRDTFPKRGVLAIDSDAVRPSLDRCPGLHALSLPLDDCLYDQPALCKRSKFCQMLNAALRVRVGEIVIASGTQNACLVFADWLRQELLVQLIFHKARIFIHVVLTEYFMSQELAGLNTLYQHLPKLPLVIWLYGPLTGESCVISVSGQRQSRDSPGWQPSIIMLHETVPGLNRTLERLYAGGLTFADGAADPPAQDSDLQMPQSAVCPIWSLRRACYAAIKLGWEYGSEHRQIPKKSSLQLLMLRIFRHR